MKLNKTIRNIRKTSINFFNIENSPLNEDLLKDRILFETQFHGKMIYMKNNKKFIIPKKTNNKQNFLYYSHIFFYGKNQYLKCYIL